MAKSGNVQGGCQLDRGRGLVVILRRAVPSQGPPTYQRATTWSDTLPVDQSPTRHAAVHRDRLFLVVALAFVLVCRLLLYVWMAERASDFDLLYDAAARLLHGENPYPTGTQRFPYPLPAVLLAVPFTQTSPELARPVFDVLIGWAFVYGLWKYRGPFALLAAASGAYLFAMRSGQTTPLMVAASLVPALGFLLAVRPNTGAALWMARPSLTTLGGASAFLGLSLLVLPSWPWDWWIALPFDNTSLMPPVLRPFGVVLLLAALRWRTAEGRLILATAFIPQSAMPYELVALSLIPANRLEMAVYVAGSWIAVAAAERLEVSWLVSLGAVYVPMLYVVLRRQSSKNGLTIEKDRRRPHRVPDEDLEVDVTGDGAGGVIVKVTHLPTQLFATETGQDRKVAERKAQDRLAGLLARASRAARKVTEER